MSEIASPAGANAAQPFLSRTRSGVVMSWLEPVPNTNRVALRFARYASGKWSAPRTIAERADFFVNWADFPSIVEDVNGVLFAHWLQKSGGAGYAYDVVMTTSADGGKTWRAPFLLNRDGKKNEHGFVSLVPLPNGGVGATWLDGRKMPEGKEEGEMSVRYATVDARGTIANDVELDGRACECCTTGMTFGSSGPVVVYRDRSNEEIRDISFLRRTKNGWSAPRTLHADGWKIAGCPVNGPQIDSLRNRLAVAWFTAAGDQARAYVALSDDGGATFGTPIRVDGGKPQGRVDIVTLNGGDAIVVWLEQTANGAELRARRVHRDGSLDAPVKFADASTARGAGFPRIARAGDAVYAAWTDQSAAGKRVRVARITF